MIGLVLLAGLVLGYGLISGRVHGTPVTAPMVFVAAGLALGAGGAGLLSSSATAVGVHVLAEATLVLVLFTDAVRIDLTVLRHEFQFPLRLLAIGMPMGLVLGGLGALVLFPSFGIWEAMLLAAVLVPTDAALGAAVVSDHRLPVRVRQTLNVESGLNDGIALPIVVVFAALAAGARGDFGANMEWLWFAARQVGLGTLVGIVVGCAGGWALTRADSAGWVGVAYRRLFVLALAVLAYAGADLVTGNGFVAAFVGGLAFGMVAREQCGQVHEFAEREGELLSMLTFTMFGAIIVGPRMSEIDWSFVLYAVLSLVVVRPLAVVVAMAGAKIRWETVLFFGWFGPRGLASILFALLVVEGSAIAAAEEIVLIVGMTVLLSVYAHGVTAAPWAAGFGRRSQELLPSAPERVAVSEHHVRHAHGWQR